MKLSAAEFVHLVLLEIHIVDEIVRGDGIKGVK